VKGKLEMKVEKDKHVCFHEPVPVIQSQDTLHHELE
jgi:hypothetical protein